MHLKAISAQTSKGPYLELNEDGYDFDLDNKLFMTFDGFGGSGIGDVCVATLKDSIRKFYTKISADPDATLPFFFSPKYLVEGNAMINAMLFSHAQLVKDNMAKEISKRAGASGIIMAKSESIMTVASVGNCTAFLYRKGVLKRLFMEDSFLFLSNNDYDSYLKTMPLSGFGLFPDLYYQIKEVRIYEGDILIALTDGVYSRVKDDEIKDIVARPDLSLKRKIHELFDTVNERGNLDNQTAMILQF